MESHLNVEILTQPDDVTCGPTCLHAVYRYFGDDVGLDEVIASTRRLESGGTLAVLLACAALRRGYLATIYTYNLHVFDPSWFVKLSDVREKLVQQAEHKQGERLSVATEAYVEFLALGGRLRFEDLTSSLIRRYLKRNVPILTGLSATYLYRSPREVGGSKMEFDDVRGSPQGHFVVLCGYNKDERLVRVADPWGLAGEPRSSSYWVSMDRLTNSILLGVITYDANLLILEPREK
jgi:hypothetical protein